MMVLFPFHNSNLLYLSLDFFFFFPFWLGLILVVIRTFYIPNYWIREMLRSSKIAIQVNLNYVLIFEYGEWEMLWGAKHYFRSSTSNGFVQFELRFRIFFRPCIITWGREKMNNGRNGFYYSQSKFNLNLK